LLRRTTRAYREEILLPRRSLAPLGAELEVTETAIDALRAELAALEPQERAPVHRIHPEWVRAKVVELEALVHEDTVRARLEIMKHLKGDLQIRPLPAEAGQRRAEITGRVKASRLLAEEEAAFPRLVAGGALPSPQRAISISGSWSWSDARSLRILAATAQAISDQTGRWGTTRTAR
jgi:hypothetical protein